MATPAIGGVISSKTGSVSLTAVPSGGWMLAVLVGSDGTPSGWTSLAISTNDRWRLVGKIKASESSMSASSTALISVMWGTGAAAVWSWQASAVGGQGSTSVSLAGTTAGSRLVGVEPGVNTTFENLGYFSRGGAVAVHTKAPWDVFYCVWSSGAATGGTATATRSASDGYGNHMYDWVLVEIPEDSTPGALTATLPGPATAALTGTSTNPGAADTALPGPPTAAIEGILAGSFLSASLPGPPSIAMTGLSTNPGSLDTNLPGPTITAGVVQYEQIQLRRPPRTLDQLLRDGTRRRDLIRIMTGAHAGAELPVASWSLTLDHLATIRATGQAEVRHTAKLAALLDPRSRTELAMILAIEDDDGQVMEWQKALLHTVPMRRGDRLTIDLEDRAAWVRAAGMRARMVMPRGMDVARALINLLSARAPWLPIDIPLSGVTLPQDAVLGGLGADPWQIAGELARATGQHLYIDAYGVARVAPIIDTLTADPVDTWSIDAAHLTDLQASISDADVVNVVGLEWQTTAADGAPPDSITGGVGWWVDDTSTVGTHILGDRVQPYPGDTSLITSPGQARDAAAAHGLTVQGIAVAVDIPGVRVDPRRDVGDIIRAQDSRLGLDLVTRLTGLTYTAGAPTMGVTLADRRML